MAKTPNAAARRKWAADKTGLPIEVGPIKVLGWVGLALAVSLSLGHFLAPYLWSADTIELFRPYVALAAFVPFVLLLAVRAWISAGAAGLAVAFNLALLTVSALAAAPAANTRGGGAVLTVVTFNCLGSNTDFTTFTTWVRRVKPDVIALEEKPAGWERALADLKDILPYRSTEAGADGGDTEIFSRFPITAANAFAPAPDQRRVVHAVVDIKGTPVEVFAVHPNTLHDRQQWVDRNEFLGLAAQSVGFAPGERPHLVLGDWNVAPWSPFFKTFVETASVRSLDAASLAPPATRILFSVLGSNVGSPIDHIAASRGFESYGCEVGPDLRSDHRPLICRVGLAPQPRQH
jgi:endonuclease/exonuclease/phosphatase (EEP) superfamily protein YafD